MSEQARVLRQLFAQPGVIRLAGAHNALGARLAERAGFEGVWSSGLEISTSYAVPDANILTMSEFLAAAESMVNAVRIPVVADCDTGYGNSNNVIHMVRRFEGAGVAAVCIEDKKFPKVNSFIPGRQELASVAEFVGKILAAKNAQRSPDFIVIARIEALIAGLGQDEALKRARAYVEAGADAILIHSKSVSVQPVADFLKAWDSSAPVVVVPTTYYDITVDELEALGAKMVIYANQGLRTAISAMEQAYSEILKMGSTADLESRIAPMKLLFELQDMPAMKRNEERYLYGELPPTRAIIPVAGDHMEAYSMKHISADTPMAMLDVNGKPLLQRQAETLNRVGISEITVVGGYMFERIDVEGVKRVENSAWQTTGDLASFMCADSEYRGRTLICYGDILFNAEILNKLLQSSTDITLIVDRTYATKEHDAGKSVDLVTVTGSAPKGRRALNPEVLHRVVRIGKKLRPEEADFEFAGLALFSTKGFELLRTSYGAMLKAGNSERFHEADSLQTASITDFLQDLIDRGHEVRCLEVSAGWVEIHSFEDYRLACRMVKD